MIILCVRTRVYVCVCIFPTKGMQFVSGKYQGCFRKKILQHFLFLSEIPYTWLSHQSPKSLECVQIHFQWQNRRIWHSSCIMPDTALLIIPSYPEYSVIKYHLFPNWNGSFDLGTLTSVCLRRKMLQVQDCSETL